MKKTLLILLGLSVLANVVFFFPTSWKKEALYLVQSRSQKLEASELDDEPIPANSQFRFQQTSDPAPGADQYNAAEMQLSNVQFFWNDTIYSDVHRAHISVQSLRPDQIVDFDHPDTMAFRIDSGSIEVPYHVLNAMMAEVFGEADSHLRNLQLDSVESDDGRLMRIRGELDLMAWIDFEMLAKVVPGPQANQVSVQAVSIRSLGFPYARGLMETVGLNMDSLVSPAADRGVSVSGNTIIIYFPQFFPPPRIAADVRNIVVGKDSLGLTIGPSGDGNPGASTGSPTGQPQNSGPQRQLAPGGDLGYSYLRVGGPRIQIGSLQIVNSEVLLLDTTPANSLRYHLRKYRFQLAKSQAIVQFDGRIRVLYNDFLP